MGEIWDYIEWVKDKFTGTTCRTVQGKLNDPQDGIEAVTKRKDKPRENI